MSCFVSWACDGMLSRKTASSIPAAISSSTIFLANVIDGLLLNEFLSGDLAQSFNVLSRKALVITETEDRLIAAAAIIGDNSVPVSG